MAIQLGKIPSLLLEQLMVILCLLCYLCGFISVSLTSKSQPYVTSPQDSHLQSYHSTDLHTVTVDKVVIIVIDALRADHLATSPHPKMPYVGKLVQDHEAIAYVTHTSTPTVTMPRLKSMVTGNIPGFMDVIMNFDAGRLKEDNIITQWHKHDKRIHCFGDDTWIKLFPVEFQESEGVQSFFVSDYTDVDNNVTRNVVRKMSDNNWDVAIFHYLGLDHIGHLEGPGSPLVPKKLIEMDNVVKYIHEALQKLYKSYLLVVTGDHGMSDAGGHGGATPAEITTSSLFVSSHIKNYKTLNPSLDMNQVDFASTLSTLTGIPLPSGNIGRPVLELMTQLPKQQQLAVHYHTAKHLIELALTTSALSLTDDAIAMYREAKQRHLIHLNFTDDLLLMGNAPRKRSASSVDHIIELYIESQKLASKALSNNRQTYDVPVIFMSLIALSMICFTTLVLKTFEPRHRSVVYMTMMVIVGLCASWSVGCGIGSSSLLCCPTHLAPWLLFPSLVYAVLQMWIVFQCVGQKTNIQMVSNSFTSFMLICSIGHSITLLASSLVEEEHQTFYFILTTFYLLILAFSIYPSLLPIDLIVNNKKQLNDDTIKTGLETGSQDSKILNNGTLVTSNSRRSKRALAYSTFHKLSPKVQSIVIIIINLVVFRVARSWNATGDKWKHLMDLGDIIRSYSPLLVKVVVVAGLLLAFLLYYSYNILLVAISLIAMYMHHFPLFNTYNGVIEARVAHAAILMVLVYGITIVKKSTSSVPPSFRAMRTKSVSKAVQILQYIEVSVSLLLLLLQRSDNTMMAALSLLHTYLMVHLLMNLSEIWSDSGIAFSLCIHWLAQANYFCQGNSNSLTTVNMSAGFVGVVSYMPLIHGMLIAVHTFGSSFITYLHYIIMLLKQNSQNNRCYESLVTWWFIRLLTITLYVTNVSMQRHHLFIWSVFSPKLLYEASHTVLLFILTLLVYSIQCIA